MVSKAFFRSKNIIPFRRELSIFLIHSFLSSNREVFVENIGLKPDCDSVRLFSVVYCTGTHTIV